MGGSQERTSETAKYPRRLRKAFAALEDASLRVSDPDSPTEAELSRIEMARQRLERRGVPQGVIEQHMIGGARKDYTEMHGHLTPEIEERPTEPYGSIETVLLDAILSRQPIVVDFARILEEGYQPISPRVRPIPPKQK